MNEDNYNKSPSTSTICLIAFSTFIITIIMYSFISSDTVEPKKERIPDKISFSTTESAKTTSTETYYNGWDDNISKPVNNDSTYYPENYYNIGNDIPE
ncbi:MAG: hypothetical protein K2O60_02260, partial [Ruminococcus sp.]|nr:hypothetical protein [Ruminococcus sp.]